MPISGTKATGAGGGAGAEDGDFVALRARREGKLEDPIEEVTDDEVRLASPMPDVASSPGHRPMSGRTTVTASRLFEEVSTLSADDFERLVNQMGRLDMVDPDSNQTILLRVLSVKRADLARIVIARADVKVLCQDCDVIVASLKGKKNALHYVTEMNDVELANEILHKLGDSKTKTVMLAQETPVQIEGQRPRTLPCCHLASFLGCKELVVIYLSNGVSVDAINSKKDTALLWAARWNHLDIVHELLSRRANTNIENDKGSTALYWAVRYGHTDSVRLLIVEGRADVNKTRKLGLVSPVILACALGYTDIVKLLVDGGADPNTVIRGKEKPIHHAAREGYSTIVEYLLQKGAGIDDQDEAGDTALLHAARHGQARCVQLLLNRGAKHTVKNHVGEDLMALAVENDNNRLLKIVLQFVKIHGSAKGSRSPLLLAAQAGQAVKISTLLSLGLEAGVADDEGNTMMHYAAMDNQHDIIHKFHGKVKVDAQNNKGNTALHVACARGHAESISVLISSKATASIRNNRGETALHIAAFCRNIQPDTVKKLMDYVIKSHAWESLNIKDNEGNNPLHIAAKFARPEVMWEFRHVPFKIKDADGNIALHEAVRENEPDALTTMLDIYEAMKRDADINEQNNKQETVLHLAAREGFKEHVARLVLLGADLSIKDQDGNTVLHTLTQLSANCPQKAGTYLAVFQAIMDQATVWWCMKHQLHFPHGDETALRAYTLQASLQLLTETYNKADLNVIAMACQVGASKIVHLILSKNHVMCYHEDDYVIYNVTNMTPLTNNSVTGCCSRGSVIHRPSYIEFLTSLDRPEVACKVLDVQPFQEIEKAYSSVAAWTYAIIMIIHIVYMTLLSYSGITLLEKRRKDPNDDSVDTATILLYVVVPVEPMLIVFYNLFRLARVMYTGELPAVVKMKRLFKAQVLSNVLYIALPIFLGIVYAVMVMVWLALYVSGYTDMYYVFSVAVCIGWMYTISFTRGFRIIHYFWRMIQNMIVKDILKFLFIYLFVLLAFSFAFHAVFQISQGVVEDYPTPFDTAFLVFNLMIGMGELFTDDFDSDMEAVGQTTTFVKIMYLLYMVLGTILLLNLLIAMMNDSYAAILHQHSVSWRIEAVQLGVDIEKAFPATVKIFSSIKFRRNLPKLLANKRRPSLFPVAQTSSLDRLRDLWYISVPKHRVRDMDVAQDEGEREALRDIKLKLAAIEQRVSSELQQVKHDLDDIRFFMKDLHHHHSQTA